MSYIILATPIAQTLEIKYVWAQLTSCSKLDTDPCQAIIARKYWTVKIKRDPVLVYHSYETKGNGSGRYKVPAFWSSRFPSVGNGPTNPSQCKMYEASKMLNIKVTANLDSIILLRLQKNYISLYSSERVSSDFNTSFTNSFIELSGASFGALPSGD